MKLGIFMFGLRTIVWNANGDAWRQSWWGLAFGNTFFGKYSAWRAEIG